ncbi:MAG TPA: hypothetical protein VGJ77_20210 [Gaiellaceae bacterium]|jgi:hypothetical protein
MRHLHEPAAAAAVSIAIGLIARLPALCIPGALILVVLGARIAYNHRGAGETRWALQRWPQPSQPSAAKDAMNRQIVGGITASIGIAFVYFGVMQVGAWL